MRDGEYIVTLTAILAHNPQTSMFTFAQLYIMKNGKLTALDHYLLVEQQKVANLKIEMALLQGDTLSVYVGYHVRAKATFGPSGTRVGFSRARLQESCKEALNSQAKF